MTRVNLHPAAAADRLADLVELAADLVDRAAQVAPVGVLPWDAIADHPEARELVAWAFRFTNQPDELRELERQAMAARRAGWRPTRPGGVDPTELDDDQADDWLPAGPAAARDQADELRPDPSALPGQLSLWGSP